MRLPTPPPKWKAGSVRTRSLAAASPAQSAVKAPPRIGNGQGRAEPRKGAGDAKKTGALKLCLHCFKAGLQFCSVGRIGPSPSHLLTYARLHSHSRLITPEWLSTKGLALPNF